jgi:TonB family protein
MHPGSAVVEFLADVSLRSLGLAAAAFAAIGLLRIRSAAGRHAVWTLTAAAMLSMAVLRPVLPPLTLRVLRPAPSEPVAAVSTAVALAPAAAALPPAEQSPAAQPAPHPALIDWRQALAAVYGAGVLLFAALLVASYGFTRRLVRASRRVESLGAGNVFESDWISVPMTVGLARPRILLPAGWREWPADKLDAALAHERMHVRRADWAIAALAGLNCCLFWFHPLAWWLRRRLAALAEQACDDATVLELGRRECYAQTLLDMTAAVRSGRGRMVWEAMAMARTAEVRNRIERILDETREIPRGWTRARWMAVAACSLPLFYTTVAVRVTAAQEVRPAPEAASQPESGQAAAPAPQPAQSPSANPAPAASPQPRNPSRIDVPGADMERRLVQKVEPTYPPEAIQAGIHGEVILETVIGADGHVKSAHPIFGNSLLGAAAQAAVMQYVYRTQGAEIASTVTVVFRLPAEAAHPPGLQNPVVVYRKEGEYTEEARRARVNGEVELELIVGKDGIPRDIRVVKSLPRLDEAAIQAVGQWRFKPALLNGVPVEAKTRVAMTFKLLPGPTAPTPDASQGPISRPILVFRKEPVYPKLAQQMGQHGTVELMATIGVDGKVKSVKVLKGPPMLMKAAQEAVMQWVYKPALVDGVAVENDTMVVVYFPPPSESPAAAPEPSGGSKEPEHPKEAQPAGTGDTAAKPPAPQISQAVLVYKRDPEYPKEAREAGQGGIVELVATIGVDGRVKAVKVLKGPPELQTAAQDAVTKWVYKPTMLNGVPVENETHISITFKPEGTASPKPQGAGTATPAQPASSAPEPPRPSLAEAVLIHHVDPEYPKMAQQMGQRGVVELVATIGTDGKVKSVKVLKGPPMLQKAAQEAVMQWVYKPTVVDGVPVENETHISITFGGRN